MTNKFQEGNRVRKLIESKYDAIPVGTEGRVSLVVDNDQVNIRWNGYHLDYGYIFPDHVNLFEVVPPSEPPADVSPLDIYD